MKEISIVEHIQAENEAFNKRFKELMKKADGNFGLERRAKPQIPVYITPEAYQYFRKKLK